jgi:hypothetical protein
MGYLEANKSFKLHYRIGGRTGLDGFCDSDWGNSSSRRSTSGMLARYNRGVISWRSKMQKTVALSTAEAEYYSASEMAIEVLYLRNLLSNMAFPRILTPHVYEDMHQVGNHVITSTSGSISQVVQDGAMELIKVDNANQLADIFTKPLHYPQFLACIEGILRIKKRTSPKVRPG